MELGIVRRLGVFGGTFDPVHNGHMTVAETAGTRLALDEVLFIPAGQPRLKEMAVSAAPHHRLRMVELATAANPLFTNSDIEIVRSGPSYTADTLERLEQERGQSCVYLIVGIDALGKFDKWGRPEAIMEMATIVGVPRPGYEHLDRAVLDHVAPGAADSALTLEIPVMDASSTGIRERVRRQQPIDHLVPGAVARYIRENNLYTHTEKGA